LFGAQVDGHLVEGGAILDVELLEQHHGGDGGHGLDAQVVHHQVRHHLLHVPALAAGRRLLLLRRLAAAAGRPLHLHRHRLPAPRAREARRVRHVQRVRPARHRVRVAPVVPLRRRRRRRRGALAEQGKRGGGENGGGEHRVAAVWARGGRRREEEGVVEGARGGVERGEGARRGDAVAGEDARGEPRGHAEEADEEVHRVLARLRVQHAPRPLVHQQLQLRPGGLRRRRVVRRGGGGHAGLV
ncbi:Os09g0544750, partial [Oryza sativa Japonica Group]